MHKVLSVIIIVLAVVGAISYFSTMNTSEDKTVSSGSNYIESEEESIAIDTTGEIQTINGLIINLKGVLVERDKILVAMTIKNTNSEELSFYPNQGNAIIGDMQLEGNLFHVEGDVSGDIFSGIQKEGIIEFSVPDGKEIDLETVTEIKFLFGDVSEGFSNFEPANFTITFE